MTPLVKFLLFIVISILTEDNVDANSLAKKAKVANSTLEYNYYNIYSKIDALEKDLQSLETRMQRKKKLLQQVMKSITDMDDSQELPDKSLKNKYLQAQKKNAVGFTTKLASKTYSSTSSIIEGRPILYNGGNAYNGTVFTCPSPGLYLFHVSMLSNTKYGGIWIYKNSKQLTLAYAGWGDPQYNGASASAAVWLDVGDQVYLRPHRSSLQVNGNSTFTGVKVN